MKIFDPVTTAKTPTDPAEIDYGTVVKEHELTRDVRRLSNSAEFDAYGEALKNDKNWSDSR